MAFYQGRPIDACELSVEEGGALGVDLRKSGNCWYKATHESASIFSLDGRRECRESKTYVMPRVGDPICPPHSYVDGRSTKQLTSLPNSSSISEEQPSRAPALPPLPPVMYWEECCEGNVPDDGALFVSKDRDGGSLFVGRAYLFGALIPGKVAVRHRVCYVALEGKEYAVGTYEVLVVKRGAVKWVPSKEGYLPPFALPSGYDLRGNTIYSAKAMCEDIDTPGHFIPAEKKCRISFNVEEHSFTEFEVLTIDPDVKTEESE